MDSDLAQRLIHTLFKFKRLNIRPPGNMDLNMREFAVLTRLAHKDSGSSLFDDTMFMSDLRNALSVTKPAISQMMNALEKKEYINREIDPQDRRRFIITTTAKGREAMRQMHEQSEKTFSVVIERFGEANTIQFITLFEEFYKITESITSEKQSDNFNECPFGKEGSCHHD